MDQYYSDQYYYYPSDHHDSQVVDIPYDFDPSYYYSPYQSSPSYGHYDHFPPRFTSSYYASGFGGFMESVLVDPGVDSTRFVVSYLNSSDFNEPIFVEYDPVPYAGGYDPSATYGPPLAPSDKICYPRSTKGGIIVPILKGLPGEPDMPAEYERVPSLQVPSGKPDEGAKDDHSGQEVVPAKETAEEPATVALPSLPPPGNTNAVPDDDDLTERELTFGDDSGNRGSLDNIPYEPSPMIPGCGLDAVDICDGIFGYWPCLEKEAGRRRDREMCNHHHHHHCHHQQGYWPRPMSSQEWLDRTADYLFGSSNPYEDRNDHGNYSVPSSFQDQVHVNASVYSGSWL